MTSKMFIGADIAQDWIDIAGASKPGQKQRIDNTQPAIDQWIASLDKADVAMIAFEPTGGLERLFKRRLVAAGLPCHRVHPNELVAFRKRRGVKAKTDQIDARLLAEFASMELSHRDLKPLPQADDDLVALVARRRQLLQARHGEVCRCKRAANSAIRSSIEAVNEILDKQLKQIESAIAAHIANNPELAKKAKLLCSMKGVGPVTAATLIAEMPELGHMNNKEIAALAGLAPCNRESGRSRARAKTGHGRTGVRQVLFNGGLCAIRHNQKMREFYKRLTEVNKRPGKVALVAVMRKMLVTLNAMVRDGEPWKQAEAELVAAAA